MPQLDIYKTVHFTRPPAELDAQIGEFEKASHSVCVPEIDGNHGGHAREQHTLLVVNTRADQFAAFAITKSTSSWHSKNDGDTLCPSPEMIFTVICPPPAS
jgi:hypothetical protein